MARFPSENGAILTASPAKNRSTEFAMETTLFPAKFAGAFGNRFDPPFGNSVLLSFPRCQAVVLDAGLLVGLKLPTLNGDGAAALLIAALWHSGEQEQARLECAAMLERQPHASLRRSRSLQVFRQPWMADLLIDGLRGAVLPDRFVASSCCA